MSDQQKARDEALEEAAQLCELNNKIISGSIGPLMDIGWAGCADACAGAIRKLKSQHADSCPPRESGPTDAEIAEVIAYIREEADFNRSWTDAYNRSAGYVARRIELAEQRERWADAIEALLRRVKSQGVGVDRERLAGVIRGLTIRATRFPQDVTIRADQDVDFKFGPESALSMADAIIQLWTNQQLPT